MRALLDTHTFLWWIADDPRLSRSVSKIISEGINEIYLSVASCWEMAIKAKLGKLEVPGDLERFIPEQMLTNAIESLPIRMSHALHVHKLPAHHRDPFDRLLIAQAQLENLPILTSDHQIARYSVEIIW